MKSHPNATWWDIANELDMLICDGGPAGCRKKWSRTTHRHGKVDQIGVYHWDGYNRHATKNGLYTFMVKAAYSKNRQYREEEDWLGLYHASLWAYKESIRVLHARIPWEHTVGNRLEVKRRAKKRGVGLRYDHTKVFEWANWKPERAKIKATGGALNG